MKKFEIRKDTFFGRIVVLYSNDGGLVSISFQDAEIDDELKQSYKKWLPVRIEGIAEFELASKATITEVSITVTFEQWYELFNLKRNKEAALKIWNKMADDDRVDCWMGTRKYLKYCQRNASWYNQMYPDTWLRNRHWRDEWDKI